MRPDLVSIQDLDRPPRLDPPAHCLGEGAFPTTGQPGEPQNRAAHHTSRGNAQTAGIAEVSCSVVESRSILKMCSAGCASSAFARVFTMAVGDGGRTPFFHGRASG